MTPIEGQLPDVEEGKSRIEMTEKREYFLEELESVGIQMEEEILEVNSFNQCKQLQHVMCSATYH